MDRSEALEILSNIEREQLCEVCGQPIGRVAYVRGVAEPRRLAHVACAPEVDWGVVQMGTEGAQHG